MLKFEQQPVRNTTAGATDEPHRCAACVRGVLSRLTHQLAFRFGAGFDFLTGLAVARLPPWMLAFRADMRSTTLLGVWRLVAAIGRPFCFLLSSSCNAAS